MGLFDDYLGAAEAPARAAVPPQGRVLLDAIAGSESPGYDVMYGGGKFTDFADHPRKAVPIASGPNAGRTSSAAGRYQFLGSTWDEVKKEANLPDFSPESQDAGAWHLANKTYKAKTGRDLATDLESAKGNPSAVQAIGRQLSGVWTSLPGGIEPNKATGSFAQRVDGPTRSTDMSSQARKPTGLFDDYLASPAQPSPSSQAPETVPSAPSPSPRTDADGNFVRFATDTSQNIRAAREGQSPTAVKTGAIEAGARGAAAGATFNFYDELRGLMEAGGLDPKDPASLGALLKGAYNYWTGDQKAGEKYDMATARERGLAKKAEADQPAASIAGNLTGAIATIPLTGGASAATLPGRIAQGGKIGGILGAFGGAGEGSDIASRVAGAATGGATGTLLGAAAAPAVEGVIKAGKAIATAARPITSAVRGVINPEAEAGRKIVQRIEADQKVGQGLTPQEFAAANREGQPVSVMDLGGDNARNLARSAANTSGEAKAALDNSINDRFESQVPRVSDYLRNLFGGKVADVEANREALQVAARQVNKPAYAKAYGSPNAQSLWDEGFEQVAQAPVVQQAIKDATRTGANRAAAEGWTPVRNPFAFNEASQRMVLKDPNVKPNLQFWDHVKRNLDDTINTLERGGEKSAAADAKQLRSMLTQRLDEMVPEFKTARAGAARFFGAEDALDAGKQFVRSNQNLDEARRAFVQLKGPERELFQQGFVSGLLDDLSRVGDRRNVLNSINQNPAAKAKLEMVLGPEKWGKLEAQLRIEGIMDLARGAVQGNSTTARQIFELTAAGGVGGYQHLSGDPAAAGSALATWALLRGHRGIDQRVAKRVGQMLASNDPSVLQKGLAIVSRNKNMMEALRSADAAIVRVGAQQGPNVPGLQSMGTGRAEEEQPNVPRPPR
jgi:muramidase (phage lysozyme)